MKKALLAVAVMATFGSASAFAAFNTATESTSNVEFGDTITIGGKINAPTSTWMTAIDKDPFASSKKEVDINAWTGKAGSWTYIVEANQVPLVRTYTKTSSVGGYPLPAIKFGEPDNQTSDVMDSSGHQNGHKLANVKVAIDPNMGTAYADTTDTTLELTLAAGAASASVGHNDYAQGRWQYLGYAGVDFASDAMKIVDDNYRESYSWYESGYETWAAQVAYVANNTGHMRSQFTAGVVGTVANGIKLVSTRDARPTGAWQATIPVQVTYN